MNINANSRLRESERLGGKMKGVMGTSTNCHNCSFCQTIRKANNPRVVCSYCYAWEGLEFKPESRAMYGENGDILADRLMTDDEISKYVNESLHRFNSHGELENEIQLRNMYAICRASERAAIGAGVSSPKFAIWTKRKPLVEAVARKYGEYPPANLAMVYSSIWLNEPNPERRYNPARDLVRPDHIFTVYETEQDRKDKGFMCGKLCALCGHCYNKTETVDFVAELLK